MLCAISKMDLFANTNRDNTVQGMRRQKQWRALRCYHLRGLQGILQKIAELRCQLPMSTK